MFSVKWTQTLYIAHTLRYSYNNSSPHTPYLPRRHCPLHSDNSKSDQEHLFSILLHLQIVTTLHLKDVVPCQSQGQMQEDNVLPLTQLFFWEGVPKSQLHHKDVMTDMSYGADSLDFCSDAQTLNLLCRHGNPTHNMFQETQVNFICIGGGKLALLCHLTTGLGMDLTIGMRQLLVIGKIRKSLSEARSVSLFMEESIRNNLSLSFILSFEHNSQQIR